MKNEQNSQAAPVRRRPALMPIIFTVLFLALCAGLLWHLWNQYAEMRNNSLASVSEIEKLQSRESSLKALLELSPCDAKTAYKK